MELKQLKKGGQELMDLLSLKETLDELARVNRVQWYRDVLRRGDN